MNRMCLDCRRFGKECPGTKNLLYSGCVFKEKAEQKDITRRRALRGPETDFNRKDV